MTTYGHPFRRCRIYPILLENLVKVMAYLQFVFITYFYVFYSTSRPTLGKGVFLLHFVLKPLSLKFIDTFRNIRSDKVAQSLIITIANIHKIILRHMYRFLQKYMNVTFLTHSLMQGLKGKFQEKPFSSMQDSYSSVVRDGNSNPELHLQETTCLQSFL